MRIDEYMYFEQNIVKNKKTFVVFYESIFLEYPQGKIPEYNTMKITDHYIDSKAFEDKMNEIFFGGINDMVKKTKGVSFCID